MSNDDSNKKLNDDHVFKRSLCIYLYMKDLFIADATIQKQHVNERHLWGDYEAEFPGWVLRCKVWFIKRDFRKLFSDVEIRTVNFYIEEVVSDVTIFVYAVTDLPKEALPPSLQIEAF